MPGIIRHPEIITLQECTPPQGMFILGTTIIPLGIVP